MPDTDEERLILAAALGHAPAREALGPGAPALLSAPVVPHDLVTWRRIGAEHGGLVATLGAHAMVGHLFDFALVLAHTLETGGWSEEGRRFHRRLRSLQVPMNAVASWCAAPSRAPSRDDWTHMPSWTLRDARSHEFWRRYCSSLCLNVYQLAGSVGKPDALATLAHGCFVLFGVGAGCRDPLGQGYHDDTHLRGLLRLAPHDPAPVVLTDADICGLLYAVVRDRLLEWALDGR